MLFAVEKNPSSNWRVFFRLVLLFAGGAAAWPAPPGADAMNMSANRQAQAGSKAFRMELPGQFDDDMASGN